MTILVLVLSMLGFVYFIYRKFGIKAEFIPFILFCIIGVTITIAGILNCMVEVTYAFLGVGIVLLCYSIFSKRLPKRDWRDLITPGTIFFSIAVLWFSFLFIGLKYVEYDNFTHWGLIVKNMLAENALPSFKNDIIVHQTYPVGSSVFIYYIVKIIGNQSESATIMAQMLLIISSVSTIFSFINCKTIARKIIMGILSAVLAICLICIGEYSTNLVVDALLPLVALGVLAIIIYYRSSLKIALCISSITFPFLFLIKTTGLLFVIFYFVLIVLLVWKEVKKRPASLRLNYIKAIGKWAAVCIISLLAIIFLWNKHVSLVFPSSESSTHAISGEYFSKTINERTDADKKEITDNFIKKVVDLDFKPNVMLIQLYMAVIIVAVGLFMLNKKIPKWLIASIIASGLTYILYMLSLYIMYMISMPLSGAKTLSSLSRYCDTIIVYVFGINCIAIAIQISEFVSEKSKNIFPILYKGFFCICAVMIALTQNPLMFKKLYQRPVYDENSAPRRIEKIMSGIDIEPTEQYFVYMPSSKADNGYSKYIFRYNTLNKNYRFSTNFENEKEMQEVMLSSKYIIIVDDNPQLADIAKQNSYTGIKNNIYKAP